jgi:phosphoribosyl-dephospho-CoA transferase
MRFFRLCIAKIKQKRRRARIQRARRVHNKGAIDYTVKVMGAIIQYKWCSHAIQHAMGQIGGKFSHFSLVSDKIISDIFD